MSRLSDVGTPRIRGSRRSPPGPEVGVRRCRHHLLLPDVRTCSRVPVSGRGLPYPTWVPWSMCRMRSEGGGEEAAGALGFRWGEGGPPTSRGCVGWSRHSSVVQVDQAGACALSMVVQALGGSMRSGLGSRRFAWMRFRRGHVLGSFVVIPCLGRIAGFTASRKRFFLGP